jgi:hypothetical protein
MRTQTFKSVWQRTSDRAKQSIREGERHRLAPDDPSDADPDSDPTDSQSDSDPVESDSEFESAALGRRVHVTRLMQRAQ